MSLHLILTFRPLRVGALCRGRVTYAPYSVLEGPVAGAGTLGRMQGCASGGSAECGRRGQGSPSASCLGCDAALLALSLPVPLSYPLSLIQTQKLLRLRVLQVDACWRKTNPHPHKLLTNHPRAPGAHDQLIPGYAPVNLEELYQPVDNLLSIGYS